MKKAIIIGASSGIGRELAKLLAKNGYEVGVISRRKKLLEDLKNELITPSIVKQLDINDQENSINVINDLIIHF